VSELPRASIVENVRLNATGVVPNAVQGIFRRRRQAVRAAGAIDTDGLLIGLMEGMNRSYGGRPVWIKVIRDDALLMFDPADIARALSESPEPLAADPEAKRKGMAHFQPDALTISRGDDWRSRRKFAESILGRTPAEHVRAVAREEAEALFDGLESPELTYEPFAATIDRIARRVVLGDGAADNTDLSDTLAGMQASANSMPDEPHPEVEAFEGWIERYLEDAEEGSLAALAKDAPQDDRTKARGQLTHWLFALGGTTATNSMRCLVALASHPEQRRLASADPEDYLDACVHEAMRLWPTTNMLSRVSLEPTEWHGETVPEGTQFMVMNHYTHRDRERVPYADRFAPEEWTEGDAGSYEGFNHFSRGPQGCPGVALAMLVARTVVGAALERGIESGSPSLDPSKPLPRMLDFFGAKVKLSSA
jgi:cytochrome P450